MNQHLFKLTSLRFAFTRTWPFFWRKSKTSYTAKGVVSPPLNIPGLYKDQVGKIWIAQDQTEDGTIIASVGFPPFVTPESFVQIG